MPDEDPKPQEGPKPKEAPKPQKSRQPAYSFQGSSPADAFLDIARIHHREAKQLLESAQVAQAEDRQEEYKLLMDLYADREKTAEEFESAARGETGDPIVTGILDSLEENREPFVPFAPAFLTKEELVPEQVPVFKDLSLKGRILSAVAWVGGLFSR